MINCNSSSRLRESGWSGWSRLVGVEQVGRVGAGWSGWSRLVGLSLLQPEIHSDCHDDLYWLAIQLRGREHPLTHGLDCGLGQQNNRLEHLDVIDPAVHNDQGLEDDRALQ